MGNKRKTLQKIAGVGAVAAVAPNSWVKPVISSIVLPAHAQTSNLEVKCMGLLSVEIKHGSPWRIFATSDTRTSLLVSRSIVDTRVVLGYSVPSGYSLSIAEHTFIDPGGPLEQSLSLIVDVFQGSTLLCSHESHVYWENS